MESRPYGPFHLLAASSLADEETRVLKHGDTFAIFDHHGDIKPGGLGEEGLYHGSTRHLSCLLLDLEGGRPFYLSSAVREENDQLAVSLTNQDLLRGGVVRVPLGSLHIALRTFLWQGTCHLQLRVRNFGLVRVETCLVLHYAADFADIFEIRGMKRKARGEDLPPDVRADQVVLAYRGLDGVERRTRLAFSPRPSHLAGEAARLDLALASREEETLSVTVSCEDSASKGAPGRLAFAEAWSEAQAERERYRAWSCHLETSSGRANAWIDRAVSDLHMLTTELPSGPYPYAGVPWFNTPFGRDGIVTALECLWLRPGLARGVLSYLAATQAKALVPEEDAEPGKILHETRSGEMAALGEMPFGRYYGSVDATPLFVVLAGSYFERTGDRAFAESLWPNVRAALDWIERHGDRDGDGFVEYERRSADGLLHQGWRDSEDAVFHEDGSPAEGPIALCEVQGYVFAALRAGAALAAALGREGEAGTLRGKAEELRRRFEAAFWCEDLATYAMALDGAKRPCRVRSSAAGQCLHTGIVSPERARRVAVTLFHPESFSGWGIRTVAESEARYNPLSYHDGSVWPHDNALIAEGLARYGMGEMALEIWSGLFEAGLHFDLRRMPELFCGFPREPGEGPTLYPVACAPQAWSAASVFLLFQACLGISVSGLEGKVVFTRPRLPASVDELRIHNLEVAGATVDLLLERRQEGEASVHVLRRDAGTRVLVVK